MGASDTATASAAIRAAEAGMASILHRAGGGRRARVGAHQPLAQPVRGVDRRRTVERHQRRRYAGEADDVGAPPILRNIYDFDQIGASCDALFEAMDGGGHVFSTGCDDEFESEPHSRRMLELHKRSVARKRCAHLCAQDFAEPAPRKKIPLSVAPQEMHDASTGFQQMLEPSPQMLDPIRPAHYA